MNKLNITSKEFDRLVDSGEDTSDLLAQLKPRRRKQETKRINVDLPSWFLQVIDHEADKLALNRQAVIKACLYDRYHAFAQNEVDKEKRSS
jgi:hypothetical protein